jgi:hypothetical protein
MTSADRRRRRAASQPNPRGLPASTNSLERHMMSQYTTHNLTIGALRRHPLRLPLREARHSSRRLLPAEGLLGVDAVALHQDALLGSMCGPPRVRTSIPAETPGTTPWCGQRRTSGPTRSGHTSRGWTGVSSRTRPPGLSLILPSPDIPAVSDERTASPRASWPRQGLAPRTLRRWSISAVCGRLIAVPRTSSASTRPTAVSLARGTR